MKYAFFSLFLLPLHAFAQDIFSMSMEEFYQIEENQRMFEAMSESGQLDNAKKLYEAQCLKSNSGDSNAASICECAAAEINKVDDRVFVFDSIVAYKSFEAKVAAQQAGNAEEFERLQQLDVERESVAKTIEKKCN